MTLIDFKRLQWLASSPWEKAHIARSTDISNIVADDRESEFSALWKKEFGDQFWASRLAAEGLIDQDFVHAEQIEYWPGYCADPCWSESLQAYLNELTQSALARTADFEEIAFATLLLPAIKVIESSIAAEDGDNMFSVSARQSRRQQWLRLLSAPISRLLELEFKRWCLRYPMQRRLACHAASVGHPVGAALFDRFIDSMQRGDMERLLMKYPSGARHFGQLIHQQSKYWSQMLKRLSSDHLDLSRWLGLHHELRFDDVHLGLSDPHDNGSVVCSLYCQENQEQIFYKPRSLQPECVFEQAVFWLQRQGLSLDLIVPAALRRDDYGWSRQVKHDPLGSQEDLHLYAQRAGAVLALSHALRTTDLHVENLIANKRGPTLIDLETIMMPELLSSRSLPDLQDKLDQSILRTKLLPEWDPDYDGEVVDVSGLAGLPEGMCGSMATQVLFANTDAMRFVLERQPLPQSLNQIILNGQIVPLRVIHDALQNGFCKAYMLICQGQSSFRQCVRDASCMPLAESYSPLAVRFLFRPTLTYDQLEERCLCPAFQTDSTALAIERDRLMQPFLSRQQDDPIWSLLIAERHSIDQGDVPRLMAALDQRSLSIAGQIICSKTNAPIDLLDQTPWQCFEQGLYAFSSSDCNFQCRIIDLVIPPGQRNPDFALVSTSDPSPFVHFIREAQDLADRLSTFWLKDGEQSAWLTLDLDHDSLRPRVALANRALYSGTAGIGLALSAVARRTGDPHYLALACESFSLLMNSSEDPRDKTIGLNGCAGEAYGLAVAGGLLGKHDWFSVAIDRLLDGRHLPWSDIDDVDVVNGISGWLLVSLSICDMYEHYSLQLATYKELLKEIVSSADELLARQQSCGAWGDHRSIGLCGFSHGASGIALALVRYACRFGCARAHDSALAAMEYEDQWFDEHHCNWPDLRQVRSSTRLPDRLPYLSSWCHGSPGILLARDACQRLGCQSNQSEEILVRARNRLRSNFTVGLDHLCCGSLGQFEADFNSAVVSDDPEMLQYVRSLMSALINRSRQSSGYALLGDEARGADHPGFFQGLSGLIYSLLRAENPQSLPCVLLLDPLLL